MKTIDCISSYPRNADFKEDGELPQGFTLEDRLLIQMSRLVLVPKVLKLVKDMICNEVDWDIFIDGFRNHRVAGFIHHHCKLNKLNLPSKVRNEVSNCVARNQRRADYLFGELDIISKTLTDMDFPVLVLKGPVLAHQVYCSRSIRPFSDIDLLVSSDGVSQVEQRLQRLGYTYVKPNFDIEQFVPLKPSEINRPRPTSLHKPTLMKIRNNAVPIGPKIDLHASNLRLGNANLDSVINGSNSITSPIPGLRVPLPEDHIILLAYHLYNHYRIPPIADVSFTRGAIWRQIGVLKYLADIYGSVCVYLRDLGDWSSLLRRAEDICTKEILTYGLFYLDFVYGKGTVPNHIMNELLNQTEISVPILGSTSVSVSSIGQLLDSEIRTLAFTIGPAIWMFQPKIVPELIVRGARAWKAQGNKFPTARCLRVDDFSSSGVPVDDAWERAEELILCEEKVDPRQFFCTHVTGGVWPIKGGVRANLRPLWDDSALFLKANVGAAKIDFVGSENIAFGEGINIYVSNVEDSNITHKIGLTIGQGGKFAPEPPPALERNYHKVELKYLRISVSTSKSGYCVEIRVPWQALNIVPIHGLRLGFDVEIIHRSSEMTIETAIAWSGGEFLSEAYPELHGQLTLA